ncbi:DUF3727 domain-containing protein [Alkalinema sp. FACHB-956]|uniref:DUF3727 domain-containing protein n=1 Tax=Alkalinema sp. FACHB-956 TaxID=2692768 RepID=UPI001689F3DE|nr:DUF3727 domain-containing protein [Alkalinema sp. FACHB-956]MBD2326851.1 DUF3727 domain-containing protein [Alkalinema sp. FACHB-956]
MNEEIFDAPTVTLTDESGLTLDCYIEHSLSVEGQEYVLLLPVDSTIEIVTWESDGSDEEEAVLVEDEAEIQRIFPTAKAVLGEQNLILKRTAVVLTVEGDLPDLEDENYEDGEFDEDEQEELQLLASFYHQDQEYSAYAHLDPYFILARMDEQGRPNLLSPDELEKIEPLLPMIEDQLFDALE